MFENGVNSEEIVNYNLLFCHACLSSNRTLSSVGEYFDIYVKICDNSRMTLTSQINICWECMALLKKVRAFRRKVEHAQKILDYCVNKQVPLEDNLSDLTLSSTETTTFDYYPIEDENADEYDDLDNLEKIPDNDKPIIDSYDMSYSLNKSDLRSEYSLDRLDVNTDMNSPYIDRSDSRLSENDELMIKIENVRGRCDILDVKPALNLSTSSSEVNEKVEPLESPSSDEERRHCRWKRSVLLVYKRICGHRYARHFMRPVSDELAPLYSRIVRRPTDLSTIKRRIKDGFIRTTAELTRALLLMFSNALMYNSSDHDIYSMTLEFREETLRELSLLQAAQAAGDDGAPLPVPARRARAPAPASAPASAPAAARLARRRATVWEPRDCDRGEINPAAAPPRRRRASTCVRQRAPAAPPRRRARRAWPGLHDQYLVANCFKKCKNTALL